MVNFILGGGLPSFCSVGGDGDGVDGQEVDLREEEEEESHVGIGTTSYMYVPWRV